MNEQAAPRNKIRLLAWTCCALLLFASAVFNWELRFREHALINHREALRQQFMDQEGRKQRLEELVKQVGAIKSQQVAEKKALIRQMKPVKTRDDFPIREGDRIVRKLVVFSPRGMREICFYVPGGQHRLVYSFMQLIGESAKAKVRTPNGMQLKYSGSTDHRTLPETASIELEANSVYKFTTSLERTDRKTVEIRLLGTDDTVIHHRDETLEYPAMASGFTNLQNDSGIFLSYPNEIMTLGAAKQHFTYRRSAPVTPLATFTLSELGGKGSQSKGRVLMRVWIDSESPPCMSDVEVLGRYRFVSQFKRSWPPTSNFVEAFDQMFQPYDGSGKYYFQDVFPQAGFASE